MTFNDIIVHAKAHGFTQGHADYRHALAILENIADRKAQGKDPLSQTVADWLANAGQRFARMAYTFANR